METSRLEEPFFPVKKLIVLIPSSGHSYPTLRDVPSQAGELEPAIIPLESKVGTLPCLIGLIFKIYIA